MRIDKLEVKNFKKFSEQKFELHPRFTLLVGENGSGKTSVLDALAVALGVWLIHVPDSSLVNSRRRIYSWEKRLEWVQLGDRAQFQEAKGEVVVRAFGQIDDRANLTWEQRIPAGGRKADNTGAKEALSIVQEAYDRAQSAQRVMLPVIGYYGAGRAWLPHNERDKKGSNLSAHRWSAFYDCLNERIRIADLIRWFRNETTESGNRQGRFRPGFEAVRRAILQCVPGANSVWFDTDRKDIVLSIDGNAQPFANLSAGQRMMLALVADIAIKAVTQNNFLVPPDVLAAEDEPLPRVLRESTGVVLIDELDVHLHPRWQRRVANDLKTTFPKIQFVCTSHSPQVIGEVAPDEILLLDEDNVERPLQSFGMDSNWILQALMKASKENPDISASVNRVFELIDQRKLERAADEIQALRQRVGNSETIQRAASTIERMRLLGK